MDTKQPEALRLAGVLRALDARSRFANAQLTSASEELEILHAENEALRAGYDAARLEIASLQERAQLAAVSAGGVGTLMLAPAQDDSLTAAYMAGAHDAEKAARTIEDEIRKQDEALIRLLLEVLQELEESSSYWSEYDVPLGIVERIKDAIALATVAKA